MAATVCALFLGICAAHRSVADMHALAYVTNTTSNLVQVADIDARTVLTSIAVGQTPVDIEESPDWRWMYVSNRGSNSVSVLDTSTNTVVATITVGRAPEGLALSPDGLTLYVANTFDNSVSVIDTTNRSVKATIAVGNFPGHIAIPSTGTPVYVVNRASGTLSVIDPVALTVTNEIAVGSFPWFMSIDANGTGYISNVNSGTVSIFSTLSNTVTGTIQTGTGPWAVLANPDPTNSQVYVTNTDDGTITFINHDGSVSSTVNVGAGSTPYELAVTPLYSSLLVPNYGNGTLLIYQIKVNSIRPTFTMTLGGTPTAVASIRANVD